MPRPADSPTAPALAPAMIAPGAYFAQHETDPAKVARFAHAMRAGSIFPAVVVVQYSFGAMALDGHHRLEAAALVGCPQQALACDGDAFEDFACEVGSFDADRLVLAAASSLLAD